MKQWSDFEIGDLVEYEDPREGFVSGIVVGFKDFHDWDVHASNNIKIKSVVVYWNSGMETNTSPLVLRKL